MWGNRPQEDTTCLTKMKTKCQRSLKASWFVKLAIAIGALVVWLTMMPRGLWIEMAPVHWIPRGGGANADQVVCIGGSGVVDSAVTLFASAIMILTDAFFLILNLCAILCAMFAFVCAILA